MCTFPTVDRFAHTKLLQSLELDVRYRIRREMEASDLNKRLWSAVETGQLELVKSSIESGADANFCLVIIFLCCFSISFNMCFLDRRESPF